MSRRRCTVSSYLFLYHQVDKVERVSCLSLKQIVSVLLVELASGGSATNGPTRFLSSWIDTKSFWGVLLYPCWHLKEGMGVKAHLQN